MDIEIPYYEDKTRISNSNIGWYLDKGPVYLHAMLTGKIEGETGQQLARGTMIHEYILQPEEFQKDYVVWNKSRPSSEQREMFCRELANSVEIEPNKAVVSAFRASYKNLPKSDDLVLSKGLKMAEEYSDYIEYLKNNDGRIMITPSSAMQLTAIAGNINEHKLASTLVDLDKKSKEYEESHNEFHINWEYEGILCKSLIDRCCFNFKNKKCMLIDLKTTVHIAKFEESMKQYDYLRQLCFYTLALKWYIKNELNDNPEEWEFEWAIVGIDTTGTNEIRVFKFNKEQIYSRYNTIVEALKNISWHQKTGKWEHTVEYYNGDGSEILNL